MSELLIRQANFNELPTLLEFEQGIIAAERPWDPTIKDGEPHYYDLANLIASPTAEVVVAELDGELIASGYAKVKQADDYLKHERYAYIGFMFVKAEHRGRGVSQKILDALLDWAKRMGVSEVRLEVYNENHSAIRAYEKAGFKLLITEMRMEIE